MKITSDTLDFIKDHIYVILGVVVVIIVGIIYIVSRPQPARIIRDDAIISTYTPYTLPIEETSDTPAVTEVQTATEAQIVVVHIAGEVNSPGVFELPYGSRINDAVQLAGGVTEYANISAINLAAFLRDAMQIVVPAIGDEVENVITYEYAASPITPAQNSGLVNINTATGTQLQTLPGVGPVIAQNIIDFREANGWFSSIDELINVAQIGATTLERLRELVTV